VITRRQLYEKRQRPPRKVPEVLPEDITAFITEAPLDGNSYVRQNGAWVLGSGAAPVDSFLLEIGDDLLLEDGSLLLLE
jgi:hypothetical protein